MRRTEYICRIDDLGRLAVPKEVREELQILSGDLFELAIGDRKSILFKKYHPQNSYLDEIKTLTSRLEKEPIDLRVAHAEELKQVAEYLRQIAFRIEEG